MASRERIRSVWYINLQQSNYYTAIFELPGIIAFKAFLFESLNTFHGLSKMIVRVTEVSLHNNAELCIYNWWGEDMQFLCLTYGSTSTRALEGVLL
jgi:hypothetical protein